MSNPSYLCVATGCDASVSYQHYTSHLLRHKYSELPPKNNLAGGVRGELVNIIPPKISGVKNDNQYKCCFGCKKMFCRSQMADKHRSECKNKDAHKQACKKMLETASTTQEAEPQATPLATPADFTDPEGKGRPLAVVIRDFQRTIERLNSVIECDKQTVEEAETKSAKADMFLDGLNYTIKYMKGEQREVYEAFLPNFQEEYPDILEFVKL